jgi:branched-chain amino acid transport system permease protein
MFYRENGQFKTSYAADQQIFPVRQDRIAIFAVLALAFVVVPLLASNYFFQAVLIPFLIMSLAAIGLNILVGYCGQISLGAGAFMAVGAYTAYNLHVRFTETPLLLALGFDGMPLLLSLIGGGLMAMLVGIVFGLPSLRIRGPPRRAPGFSPTGRPRTAR